MGWKPGKYLKKIGKGIKKVVKKIGRGIKKVAKGLSKAFGKLGVLGQIGLMFIPGVGQILSGMLGTIGQGAATFITNTFGAVGTAAVNGFKAIIGGVKAASGAMNKVFSSVTDAVMGGVDWITKTVSGGKFNTVGDAFDGFKSWVQDTGNKIFKTDPTATKSDFLLDNIDESNFTEITHGSGDSILSKTKTYSAADQNILDNVSQYKEKGLSNLADDSLKNLSPEGKVMYDSSITTPSPKSDFLLDNIDESKVTQITHSGGDAVKNVAKENNNVFDKIVSKGVDEVKSGMTQGLRDKGRELVTGKPPVPNYVTNNTPDWLSTMSVGGLDSNVVAQTDFALQQRGGLYGSTGGTISGFGQEFIQNYGQNDSYTTVMRSLMT
tara:strand:+ start:551 stop:1690 length:1140 start_codon:yes stop_codon:yes gene_type:complete